MKLIRVAKVIEKLAKCQKIRSQLNIVFRYRIDCQRIFELQNQVLSSSETIPSDDEQDQLVDPDPAKPEKIDPDQRVDPLQVDPDQAKPDKVDPDQVNASKG